MELKPPARGSARRLHGLDGRSDSIKLHGRTALIADFGREPNLRG